MVIHRDFELEKSLQNTIDSGYSVWVIGDVHGHISSLNSLLSKLELSEYDQLVSLGDLIDRGPDSAGVMRLFQSNSNYHFIRGNHEDLMLRCLCKQKKKACKSWLKYGGLETLKSFGVKPEDKSILSDEWCDFLSNAPSEIILQNHRLLHAGINPTKLLENQIDNDRLWSRNIFEFSTAPDPERQVIVGHTPTQEIEGHNDSTPWYSDFVINENQPAIVAIDTGICLDEGQQPTLTALCLSSGKLARVERI